jgi:hypothetical protein
MPPGQLSGDGKWQWDGKQWVPAPPVQTLAPTGPDPPAAVVSVTPTNILAVVSLVAGILCWVLVPVAGALVAIIAGHIARGQIRRTGESGKGLALIGIILGYVHLVVVTVGTLVWLAVVGWMFWVSAHGGSH